MVAGGTAGGIQEVGHQVSGLALRVRSLISHLGGEAGVSEGISAPDVDRLVGRLRASVLRPLELASAELASVVDGSTPGGAAREAATTGDGAFSGVELDMAIWAMAVEVTTLAQNTGVPVVVGEAVAALQDIACRGSAGGAGFDATRCAELLSLQAARGTEIVVSPNGPLLASNVELVDWLGVAVQAAPTVALCRCGASAAKPWCDGSHAGHFSDAKDPKRVADRLDTYPGAEVTVSDNRGTCAHAGFCTDRLPTVFRAGKEPFVAVGGGRMDEIARAVRACPSGALGMRLFDDPGAGQADQPRSAVIEISRDGPYRMRGGVPLRDGRGDDVERTAGASREHYSLCRCGHSLNKPFCSGMHWYVDFRDPPLSEAPSLFEWAGGVPAFTRLARLFYEKFVPDDPVLAELFGEMAVDLPVRTAAFLVEVFGGPRLYSEHYGGYAHMLSRHAGAGITEAQRARWVAAFSRCADEAGLPSDAEFRSSFSAFLDWGSRTVLAASGGS